MSLEKAKELTRVSEGLKLKAYQDTGGVWTIGYGQTGKWVVPNLTCTKDQAEQWLNDHYLEIQKQIAEYVKVVLNDDQLGALCDFIYNIGIGQFKTSTLLKKLNAGDYKGASDEFQRWVYDNGVKLNGLVVRRQREKDLYLIGDWK